jgi:hypothetical protein
MMLDLLVTKGRVVTPHGAAAWKITVPDGRTALSRGNGSRGIDPAMQRRRGC